MKEGAKKYPQTGGMGGITPFAKQSRKKEWDNGHDSNAFFLLFILENSFIYWFHGFIMCITIYDHPWNIYLFIVN